MRLLIRDPLVDGTGDAMLCAVCDFFIIGHLLTANMSEWVEVISAEATNERASEGHHDVRLGILVNTVGDEEGKKSYQIYTLLESYVTVLQESDLLY
jgi:hypothetical protein